MLRLFKNSRKTVYGTLIVGAAVIGMTSFGVSTFGGNNNSDKTIAVKVGETELEYKDYLREKNSYTSYLRKRLGAQYDLFASQSNLKEEFTDDIINKTAENAFIKDSGFVSGKEELISFIKNNVFGGQPVNSQLFQMIAQSQGLTPEGLEEKLKDDVVRNSLSEFLEQANIPSKKEIEVSVAQSLSSYDLNIVEISKSDFKNLVPPPSDEQLESFYQEQLSSYELPARVRYVYSEVPQVLAEKNIQILPDDIEVYYAQNQEKFKNEKEVKADLITFKIPDGTLPDAVEKIREKAENVKKEIDAGGDFSDLMVQHSDEKSQKVSKDGFLSKKDLPSQVLSAVFALEPGKISDVIRTVSGFYIAKLNEVKDESYKPLEEVKDEIVKLITQEQAPLLLSQKALDLAEKFNQAKSDLKSIAKEEGLLEPKETPLLSDLQNPELASLTKAALESPDVTFLSAEMGEKTYILQVLERKDKEMQGFTDVKASVKLQFEERELSKKFNEQSQELKEEAKVKTLSKLSAEKKLKLTTASNVSEKDSKLETLKSPLIKNALFRTHHMTTDIVGPVVQGDKAFILEVTKVTPPVKEELMKAVKDHEKEIISENAQRLRMAIIEKIKSEKEVYVNPMVYSAWD